MLIKFGSWGKEAEDIESGKVNFIIRDIDWWNPVFEEIEHASSKMALASVGDLYGRKKYLIYIRGDIDETFLITRISYIDGKVKISWDKV